MGKFFSDVGWILLGVVCGVIAIVLGYQGFVNLASHLVMAIIYFVIATIAAVFCIAAFRQV